MAWADMDDIGRLTRFGAEQITALCVIGWDTASLRPWVSAVQAEVLGVPSVWEGDEEDEDGLEPSELDPVVVEGLKSLTQMINHNNTISAGFEKDTVVAMLLGLHRHRYPMDPDAVQAWALAHGWSGKNPERLAAYVRDINAGKRPRTRRGVLASDVIAQLERRAAGEDQDDE